MKKVMVLLAVCFMILGASKALADSRSDALNVDSRFINDVDNIWFYPNLVNDYKNLADTRTNGLSTTGVWGGLLDGEHTGLGVIGAYVYRPYGYGTSGRGWNFNAPGDYGTGQGWNGNFAMFANGFSGNYTGGNFNVVRPENKVDLFWGTSFDKGNFGVQVNYADAEGQGNGAWYGNGNQINTNNQTPATDASVTSNNDTRVLGLNLGLGLQDVGPFNSFNIHAGYSMATLNYSEVNVRNAAGTGAGQYVYNNSLKDNGISAIVLGALGDSKIDDNSSMRTFADVVINQNDQTEHMTRDDTANVGLHLNANDRDETFGGQYNDINATIGFGCNHKVLDGKATISSGLQATWVNSDEKFLAASYVDGATTTVTTTNGGTNAGWDEWSQDLWDIAWNASVEAKVASWLTARAGVNRPIVYRTNNIYTYNTYAANAIQSTAKASYQSDSYFGNSGSTYSMGFGINFENWEVDATTNVGSVFNSIGNVRPGSGIFFNGSIVTSYDADIRYQF